MSDEGQISEVIPTKAYGNGFVWIIANQQSSSLTIFDSDGIPRHSSPVPTQSSHHLDIVPIFSGTSESVAISKLSVAKGIIKALRKNKKYTEAYLNYISGGATKDEFKKESLEYAIYPREISVEALYRELQIAKELTGEDELPADEIGALLEVTPMDANRAIQLVLNLQEGSAKEVQNPAITDSDH